MRRRFAENLRLERQHMKTDIPVFGVGERTRLRTRVNLSSRLHFGVVFKNVQDSGPECPQAWESAPVRWLFNIRRGTYADQNQSCMVDFRIITSQ
ncbi:hypothetical protein S101468_02453 [Acetobacter pasteurianus subsp. pasteurianus]|uniref:Uncharacterized protein n=1 Tax=Acetobacter pasteurianus subsp. pasteurianus TaxID=481145 RepID=A0AAC9SSM3_ACEPA|nr:hypothetical protein S101468_02453 [Acetobacter pasteurianus subsp. pasteurianus]